MWDVIPNAPKNKSAFSVESAYVYILRGNQLCTDPSSLGENSSAHLAKNANQLLVWELENKDFKDSRRLAMLEAFFETVAKMPASQYILGQAISGLGPSMMNAKRMFPAETTLGQAVQKIADGWTEQKNKNPVAWSSATP